MRRSGRCRGPYSVRAGKHLRGHLGSQPLILKTKDLRLREGRYLPHVTRPGIDRESTEARSLDPTLMLFTLHSSCWALGVGGHDSRKVADLQLDASRLCVAPFTLFDGGVYSRSRFSSAAGVDVAGWTCHSLAPHTTRGRPLPPVPG